MLSIVATLTTGAPIGHHEQVGASRKITFDGWSLDPQSGELTCGDRILRLPPQPLGMLCALLAQPGQVVTRERMTQLLWPGGVVDFDNGLNAAVRKLRVALGDDADTPRYIETLPRIGYRFVGRVTTAAEAGAPAPLIPANDTAGPLTRSRRLAVFAAGMVIAAVAIALLWWPREPGSSPTAPASSADASDARNAGTTEKAYELYLQGKFNRSRRDMDGTSAALADFEAALTIDPYFGDGWAELASTWAGAAMTLRVPVSEAYQRAREAALRAIDLGDETGHGRAAFAQILSHYDLDLRRGEAELQASLQADGQYARAWHTQALLLAYQGRIAEAFEAMRRARELEPMTLLYGGNHGVLLYQSRRFEEAAAHARLLLESQPRFDQARSLLIRSLVASGKAGEALEHLALRISDRPSVSDAGLVYAHLDRRRDALAEIGRIERIGREGFGVSYDLAAIHAALGNLPAACSALERAIEDHSLTLPWLRLDPRMDVLRGEACYLRVARRVYGDDFTSE